LLESDEIHSDTAAAAAAGQGDASVHEGDVEQGLVAGSDAEAGSNKSEEDCAVAVSFPCKTPARDHVLLAGQHMPWCKTSSSSMSSLVLTCHTCKYQSLSTA
jgi:hypothetical protein